MVKYLLNNPAVFVGNNFTFFDYNKNKFFKVLNFLITLKKFFPLKT